METASAIETKDTSAVQADGTRRAGISWEAILRSPAFVPALLLAGGLTLMFWQLISRLPRLWMSDDGYYSHGFLVPFITGYVIYKKWDKFKTIPVKAGWVALPFMALLGYLAYVSTHTSINAMLALTFLLMLLTSVWLVAGWRWMLALSLPLLYLGFALPLWTGAIELNTNRAQLASTTVAYQLLKVFGFTPYQGPLDPTIIYLNNFKLDVAVPCSGLKLILAVTAFTALFMMIGGLKWWGNLVMVAVILPLCVFVNGLRIALIGIVGDTYGRDAGLSFHDYSGYITLLLCFFLLFKIARGLGWKD